MASVYCPCCRRVWRAIPDDRMLPWQAEQAALHFVSAELGVSEIDLFSHRRPAPLVEARALFVWIVKTYGPPDISYPEIARMMGGRDHTTVLHLWREKIPQLLDRQAGFVALTAKFAAQAGLFKETLQ